MSRSKSDYQSNQRPGLRTTDGQLYSNFEIAFPFSEYHKQELGIAKILSDGSGEERAYGNLGTSYLEQRDFEDGTEYRNLEPRTDVKDRAGGGCAPGNLGVDYCNRRDSKNAITFYKQELQNAQDDDAKLRAYANLGYAYRCFGNLDEAIANHNQELEISKKLQNKAAEGSAYENLGIAYHKAGKYDDAIKQNEPRNS